MSTHVRLHGTPHGEETLGERCGRRPPLSSAAEAPAPETPMAVVAEPRQR